MSRIALWAVPVPDLGGVARHAIDMAAVGIPGFSLAFLLPAGPLADLLDERGATVHRTDFGVAAGTRRSREALESTIARIRPAVVHTHLAHADVSAALVRRHGAALISTEHGLADDDLVYHHTRTRSLVARAMHFARWRRFDGLIAVSQATLRVAEQKWRPPRRVLRTVIRNGVDPLAQKANQAGLRILSLSRLAPEKRLPDLVDSFTMLHDQHPEATLRLAGVGPLEARLRRQVNGLGGSVDLPGYVDAAAALDDADVVAQLSVWENCSYTLLDALARRRGIVASPVGGNVEMLPAHCLVDPADHARVAGLLAEQGTRLDRRPELPTDWPTTAEMAARTGAFYEKVLEVR